MHRRGDRTCYYPMELAFIMKYQRVTVKQQSTILQSNVRVDFLKIILYIFVYLLQMIKKSAVLPSDRLAKTQQALRDDLLKMEVVRENVQIPTAQLFLNVCFYVFLLLIFVLFRKWTFIVQRKR
jgi:hypothetical protein